MTLALNLYSLQLVVTIAICTSLLLYALNRRDVPGGAPFVFLATCVLVWVTAYLLELVVISPELKLTWFNVRQVGVAFIAVAWLLLAWEYHQQDFWRSRLVLAILFTIPLITVALIATSEFHTLLRERVYLASFGGTQLVRVENGDWSVASTGYSLGLQFTAMLIIGADAVRGQGIVRRQALFLLLAMLFPLAATLLSVLRIELIAPLGQITLTFVPSMLCAAWALFRYGLLDISRVTYRRIVDEMGDAVVVIDRSGHIVLANEAASHLLNEPGRASLVGALARDVPLLAGLQFDLLAFPVRPSHENVTHNNRIYELSSFAITQPGQQAYACIVLLRDVTARYAALQQAVDLNTERERSMLLKRFVSDVSHDLRTPIATVKSSVYLITRYTDKLRAAVSDPALQELLHRIDERATVADDSVERLHMMVNDMLEMVRLDTMTDLALSRYPFDSVVHDLVRRASDKAEARGIHIDYKADSGSDLLLDGSQFFLAVSHVLENAIQYSPDGAVVTVRTSREQDEAVLSITDTGRGINPEDLSKVFTPFFRADTSRPSTGGSGLGLSMAKRIIEAHKGTISLASTVGKGTTVTIRLPITQAVAVTA
jgi:signal transduction histidine kinase